MADSNPLFSEHRTNQLRRLFGNSEGADVLFVCGEVTWNAHTFVLQLGSKVLGKMCSGSFQEVITGRIELKQHEPHLVHRMLQHLYMVDYSASEIETDGKKEESFVSELHTHVMMYAMGDEYDIKDLKEEALWKFNKAVEAKQEQSDEPTSVLEVVPAIYTTTPDSDRGLRDAVVAWGAKRLGWIHDLADFKSAVTQVPTYMLEVLPTFLKRLEDDRRRYIGEYFSNRGYDHFPTIASRQRKITYYAMEHYDFPFGSQSRAIEPFLETVGQAALLTVSSPAASETVDQHASVSALPSDPIPHPLSTPYSVPGNPVALQLPHANYSLSLAENSTASLRFHIPDTPIDLIFTGLGHPLDSEKVSEIVERAIDKVSTNLDLHPTESITNGFFQQRNEGLAIRILQYIDKQVTWSLLNQLLWGMRYFTSQLQRSCELRFEIDVADQGRVGCGSLWETGLDDGNVVAAKRAVNDTPQHLPNITITTSISKPALTTNSNRSLLSPLIPNESPIIFSYHFHGPPIPGPAISACFNFARHSIRANVQLHPQGNIPDGSFQYRADGSAVAIGIQAYADKHISWLLLDRILRRVGDDLIAERHLWACEFEFEIYPVDDPLGHGFLAFDAAAVRTARVSGGDDGRGG
ncbi:MAG: hypothetical protein ASARMPREDX12_009615 [Alectoria sarmentosa]|nr:MAG: hypothetical protein ASARMPREDX12_009615 [Alectoria sarmentosa]